MANYHEQQLVQSQYTKFIFISSIIKYSFTISYHKHIIIIIGELKENLEKVRIPLYPSYNIHPQKSNLPPYLGFPAKQALSSSTMVFSSQTLGCLPCLFYLALKINTYCQSLALTFFYLNQKLIPLIMLFPSPLTCSPISHIALAPLTNSKVLYS